MKPSSVLAVVVPKSLFIQISEQMEWLDRDVGSFQVVFQARPEVFDPVRMDIAYRVGLGMVNNVMNVFAIQSIISDPLVCINFRNRFRRVRAFCLAGLDALVLATVYDTNFLVLRSSIPITIALPAPPSL